MRAAIYARVSTAEQSTAMQVRELEDYCRRRGWEWMPFEDVGSGAREKRPRMEQMMLTARRRGIDVVVVWKFDRFARSVSHLVRALEEFKALGIGFVSLTEQIDTTTPAGELVFHIFAAVAQFERELTRERVKAGLAHARSKGTVLGRPSISGKVVLANRAITLRESGKSWKAIAESLHVSVRTLRRMVSIGASVQV